MSQKTTPLVSVVMPTFNRATLIAESLESVFAQTYPRLEVIVVDDGSEDETQRAVAPYRDRITYLRQVNQGLSAARNVGMRAAHGDFIAWIDSDDIWEPRKTALQVAFLERHPDVVLVSTDFVGFDENGPLDHSHVRAYYSVISRLTDDLATLYGAAYDLDPVAISGDAAGRTGVVARLGHIYDHLVFGNFIHPPTVMLRRSAVEKAGDLDPALRFTGDYEYFVRLARLGRVGFIEDRLVRYRHHGAQLSNDRHLIGLRLEILAIAEKVARCDPEWVRRNRVRFRERLGFCHVALAAAVAPKRPAKAVRHVAHGLALGQFGREGLRALLLAALPLPLLGLVRRLKMRALRAGLATMAAVLEIADRLAFAL